VRRRQFLGRVWKSCVQLRCFGGPVGFLVCSCLRCFWGQLESGVQLLFFGAHLEWPKRRLAELQLAAVPCRFPNGGPAAKSPGPPAVGILAPGCRMGILAPGWGITGILAPGWRALHRVLVGATTLPVQLGCGSRCGLPSTAAAVGGQQSAHGARSTSDSHRPGAGVPELPREFWNRQLWFQSSNGRAYFTLRRQVRRQGSSPWR
jgi:hypothetical protein